MKKIILIAALTIVFVIGIFKFTGKEALAPTPTQTSGDHKNIAYQIEGQEILLKNGSAETAAASDSAGIITTEYFGNEAKGDFNNDGKQDVAFVLTQNGGGTGVFFYAVVAIKTATGYKGTNAVYLGDRIAPQTTEFRNGEIIVNYADRKPNEPFSADPSVGVSKYLKVNGLQLLEVSQ